MQTTPRPLVSFDSWFDLLDYLTGRGDPTREHRYVWYQAPLDSSARLIRVAKVYKNGKVRLAPNSRDADAFTADVGHLDRFRRYAE